MYSSHIYLGVSSIVFEDLPHQFTIWWSQTEQVNGYLRPSYQNWCHQFVKCNTVQLMQISKISLFLNYIRGNTCRRMRSSSGGRKISMSSNQNRLYINGCIKIFFHSLCCVGCISFSWWCRGFREKATPFFSLEDLLFKGSGLVALGEQILDHTQSKRHFRINCYDFYQQFFFCFLGENIKLI